MSCPTAKGLCNHLIISSGVTFTANTLVINLPAGNYANNEKYCIVVAQAIPDTTTINAPVAITIGADAATTYPMLYCNGTQVLARSINTRTRYSVVVKTNIESGVFKLIGKLPCTNCSNNTAAAPSLPLPAAAE